MSMDFAVIVQQGMIFFTGGSIIYIYYLYYMVYILLSSTRHSLQVTLPSSVLLFLYSLHQSYPPSSCCGYKENFKLKNPTTTSTKTANFPICFIYLTHTFQQGTYLQASGGLWVEEHLIPNRTPLLILNGMEILEILNNSTWATHVTLDETGNNHLTNVIKPTIVIWQLKPHNLPVAESQNWI